MHDQNGNHAYDWNEDRILVGPVNDRGYWAGSAFALDFKNIAESAGLPKADDVYRIFQTRPFWSSDSIIFSVNSDEGVDRVELKSTMDSIKVVPNPYVATNMMEPSVVNKYLNQSRRLLFTNLPAQSTIKIFTISGMLVRELHAPEDGLTSYNGLGDSNTGVLHWDMISWEGLEIAAGMYFYHVKDDMTGEEKTGKFAVIK